MKLEVAKKPDELIEDYALLIANQAILKEISIEYAFSKMLQVVSASEYDSRYIGFYQTDEDIDYLTYDNSVLFNSGLTIENSNDFILEEFKIFVEMENLKISKEERVRAIAKLVRI